MSSRLLPRHFTAERPRVGCPVLSVCQVATPGVTVADVTTEPVTTVQRRFDVVHYWGIKLSSGPWVSQADCALACDGG